MKSIVVIDDDPSMLDIIKLILERAGYTVSLYLNARMILENNCDHPDLFLLDKQLSGIDGLDLCRHLKSRVDTKDIPVVIISATPGLAPLAEQASADDYLEKPFNIKELLAIVKKHLPAA